MKRHLKQKLSRGRVDLFLTAEGEGLLNKQLEADDELLHQYITKLTNVKDQYKLTGAISIDTVAGLEGIFTVRESDQPNDQIKAELLNMLDAACTDLVDMRNQEGERLVQDLLNRLQSVKDTVAAIEERRPVVVGEYKAKVIARVEAFINEEIAVEDSRVLQEVALLAEKGDITEEITRLYSHIDQFHHTLENQEPIGRTLDFIVQEMHREINTIGSKSNDSQLSNSVVMLKSEVEKMKEQVQNIE